MMFPAWMEMGLRRQSLSRPPARYDASGVVSCFHWPVYSNHRGF